MILRVAARRNRSGHRGVRAFVAVLGLGLALVGCSATHPPPSIGTLVAASPVVQRNLEQLGLSRQLQPLDGANAAKAVAMALEPRAHDLAALSATAYRNRYDQAPTVDAESLGALVGGVEAALPKAAGRREAVTEWILSVAASAGVQDYALDPDADSAALA